MPTAKVCDENSCLYVSGELNFQTVMSVWNDSLPLLAKYQELNVDFSRVTQANSAVLALLLEWLKYAKQHHKTISFNQAPAYLKSIASVAGVESLISTHFT